MVTLCDIGIELSFVFRNSQFNVSNIAESVHEMDSVVLDKIEFKELENVELEFHSNNASDCLYFDGIDMLPEEFCEMDENGNLYLKPLEEKASYPLFQYETEYYAMRVGTFEIKIKHDNQVYYQWFTVTPKNMGENEWHIMKSELEEAVQGLSSDMIKKNISIGNQSMEAASGKELYKFFVIKQHFSNILAALIDLKDRPNYKIEKDYSLEPLYHATWIDHVTVKDYLKKGTGEEKYLVPKSVYNYDLPENRWLKHIITFYEKELLYFEKSLENYIKSIEEEIDNLKRYSSSNIVILKAKQKILDDLSHYMETSKTILNVSNLIKKQDWYHKVKEVDSLLVPHVLVYDVRYNAFYKMYRELLQDNFCIAWNDNYAYCWKLSSKMYEIWCFIKLCGFMISDNIGFAANGWIFSEFEKENVLVPELLSGTMVEFTKNEFVAKLYYDVMLENEPSKTEVINHPVFSKNSHNRPDIRMDLYKKGVYWSSLIFEVKYRTIKSFWLSPNSACREQIYAYKNDTASKFSQGLDENYAVRKIRPVDRVWVFNPTVDADTVVDKSNEGIKFIQLVPGANQNEVIEELFQEINDAFGGELGGQQA